MRKLITIFLVCACVLLTTTAVRGGLIISFDENGNGNIGGITPLLHDIGISPYGGPSTLYYVLPVITVVDGDVKVMELIDTISDVLRFVNGAPGAGGSRVYVYSDIGDDDLADTGIPTQWQSNVISVTEEGTEGGWNGVLYTPTSGQPGCNPSPGGTLRTYNFTSDVPEPATIALLGLGALSLIRRKR